MAEMMKFESVDEAKIFLKKLLSRFRGLIFC